MSYQISLCAYGVPLLSLIIHNTVYAPNCIKWKKQEMPLQKPCIPCFFQILFFCRIKVILFHSSSISIGFYHINSHFRIQRFLYVLCKRIFGHCDNQGLLCIFPVQPSIFSGGFLTVQLRHLNIHQKAAPRNHLFSVLQQPLLLV